jgi:8-oxo-dGTP diphosphatase
MIKCSFENGNQAHLRHVTVDALIEKNNRLLLVKRDPNFFPEPGKYVLPGGYLERDETADQGVIREVLEETGYEGSVKNLLFIMHKPRVNGDDRQNIGFFYHLKVSRQVQAPDHEIESIHWFDVDALPNPDTVGFDHLDIINLFLQYLRKPYPLPVINPL